MPDSLHPMNYTLHGILQVRVLESIPFSRGSSQPRDQTQISHIAGRFLFLPAETQGKPKNIGVGSLSLLQGLFLIQEWNRDLLHYRLILYQFSYQGSPISLVNKIRKKKKEGVGWGNATKCTVVMTWIFQKTVSFDGLWKISLKIAGKRIYRP